MYYEVLEYVFVSQIFRYVHIISINRRSQANTVYISPHITLAERFISTIQNFKHVFLAQTQYFGSSFCLEMMEFIIKRHAPA